LRRADRSAAACRPGGGARGGGRRASVIVADENAEAGGALLRNRRRGSTASPAWDWAQATVAALKALGVRLMTRTTAFGYYAPEHARPL
jgi:sarcosine oxidase subunit alpha